MKADKATWEKARQAFAQGTSYKRLSEEYGIAMTTIKDRARKENWNADRETITTETSSRTSQARERAYARVGQDRADRLRGVEEAAEKLARVLDRVCTALDNQADFSVIDEKQMRGLQSLASALKTNGEQLATMYGVMDAYKKQQIEMAWERLAMEKAQQEAQKVDKDAPMFELVVKSEGEPLDE